MKKLKKIFFCTFIIINTILLFSQKSIATERSKFMYINLLYIQNDYNVSNDAIALRDAIYENNINKVKELVNKGININLPVREKHFDPAFPPLYLTPLKSAALQGNDEIVKFLLDKGALVNPKDKDNDSDGQPMLMCVKKISTLKILIESGAKIDDTDNWGNTSLKIAAHLNYKDAVTTLISYGARPNIKGEEGNTALLEAAMKGNTEIIQILIESGADIDHRNNDGTTALMLAASHDNLESVKLLVNAGANIKVEDLSGKIALDYAQPNPYLPNNKKIRHILKNVYKFEYKTLNQKKGKRH
jgi:ankyrin repeat protein